MSPPAIIDHQSPETSFKSGRTGPVSTRSKPRFIKQRKSSRSSSSTPSNATLPTSASHFNPFRAGYFDSLNSCNFSNGNISNGNICGFDTNVNSSFVFSSSSDVNVNNDDDDVAGAARVSGASSSLSGAFCNNNDDIAGNVGVFKAGVSSSGVYCNYDDNIAGNAGVFRASVYCNNSTVVDKNVVNNGFRDSGSGKHGGDSEPFVFGVGGKGKEVNEDGKCGGYGLESELVDEIGKLNIENRDKGKEKGVSLEADQECNVKSGVSNDGESFFVFNRCGRDMDGVCESSVPPKEEGHGGNAGKIDEDVFVFGSSIHEERDKFSSWSEVGGVHRSVDRKSSLGTQGEKDDPVVGSASMEKNEFAPMSFSSSVEFKPPDLDSSLLFSETLLGGLGVKHSSLRTRVSKDKNLKGKSRQSKPTKKSSLRRPVSNQYVVQGDEECYSPMDFSPYEASSSNHDVPQDVHETSQQTKAKNENVPFTESRSNLVFMSSGLGAASTDASVGVGSNSTSGHDDHTTQFCFNSNCDNTAAESFAFPVTNSTQNHIPSVKRLHKKKYRLKNAKTCAARDASVGSIPQGPGRLKSQGANSFVYESNYKSQTAVNEEQGSESALSEVKKACDKWRRRGNEAYEKGELSKAEEFYTWGVNCIPPGDESTAASQPLVRCYSNRAATRMALGRLREAILDCVAAVTMDPTFHRAQVRAANCYLQLGELEEAMQCFSKLMDSATVICLDRQIVISASEGIQKSQKVTECMSHCSELLKLRTSDAAASALELIAEGLSISLYSEKLLEMKAEALCMIGNHEEAIKLCQKSLDFAEKNFIDLTSGNREVNSSCLNVRLWRCRISSKCYFHMGRLEAALDLLEKSKFPDKSLELPFQFADTMHELLKQKNAGNIAFQSGKHAEAIELYTSAILCSMESRPFAAICFCNRAAAHQALGQIADAIADCSLAIALNEDYAKAVSRRATLHEMIRDYKQAAADLERLVSLLQKQSRDKSKQSGSGNGKELRQVQQRLSVIEEEAKKDVPLDLYLILGTKNTDAASEIKKAYRKAALRHHPDKACQFLVRGDVGDEGHRWKDIAELVHKDSDRLFKMIGEAYAVLSDPRKREEYDEAEEMRKALKESNDLRRASRRHSEYYYQGYPFERSHNARYWQDHFKGTYSHRRW